MSRLIDSVLPKQDQRAYETAVMFLNSVTHLPMGRTPEVESQITDLKREIIAPVAARLHRGVSDTVQSDPSLLAMADQMHAEFVNSRRPNRDG